LEGGWKEQYCPDLKQAFLKYTVTTSSSCYDLTV